MTALRKDDKFRFSLQWGSDTEEKVQVGLLLEQLGNRKSDFIVMAVADYVQRHPEVVVPGVKVKITYQPRQTEAQLRETIRHMVRAAAEEYLAGKVQTTVKNEDPPVETIGPSEQDLDAMLAGLKLFDL